MTMAAVVTHRHVLIKISKIFSVVDHFLYIDWQVELLTPENCIYTFTDIKILEIRRSKKISYVNLPRTEDQLWTASSLFKCGKVLRLFNIIFSNLRFMFDCYLMLQNMKKCGSVFVNKYTWISLWIFIWQRWTFVNVIVNTSYLDPSSEFFFYLILFSLSMWFRFTKKVNDSWFSLRCQLVLPCTFCFVTLTSSFIFFPLIETAAKQRWVLLPLGLFCWVTPSSKTRDCSL